MQRALSLSCRLLRLVICSDTICQAGDTHAAAAHMYQHTWDIGCFSAML